MGIRKLIIIVSSTVIQFFAFSKLLTRVQVHKSDFVSSSSTTE